jgi:hypothetical protein
MPATDLLRPSRDGDQFHYYWAARRSLQLLLPDTALTELVVESSGDASPDDASEQVIDLTEHWEAGHSPQVVYRQLKHSTLRADVPWTASFLKRTVIGFSQRYARLRADRSPLASACEFVFLTNRPAAPAVTDALDGLRAGQVPNDAASLLRGAVAEELDDEAAADFFSRLRLDTEGPGLLRLTHLFRTDIATVLPGTSGSEDVLLKEMIARRATSLQGRDPRVTKETVLAELGTSADQLLPAPSDLDPPRGLIETEQIGELVGTVASAQGTPVLIHAAGGVGKTVLAQSLNQHLPAGSISLVYDCFAKGGYRRSSTPRHQHAQAYVQISNELAARGLCRPLVPSPTATAQDYSRALMDRLSTASAALAATHPGGLLTIVVDAADNAVMVADERAERAFVPDLIREVSPPNVRFVFLCRTERRHLLNPPPQCRQARLLGFGAAETATHLAQRWQGVGANDAAEFHRRTAGNPRVQALVIATAPTLDDALRSLGEPKVADQAVFDHLLERRVAAAKDAHGDPAQIDGLCRALATLRPRIPIRVLAALAACEPDLIHSFASDLGRPLLIDGDAVQFRDEPSETWFRSQHRPAGADLSAFIGVLAPLAEADAYAATALPQLLYEARRTEDLVSLALSSRALPAGSDLERHEIARQRAHFALKAALREGRDLDAARLAVRAGHLAAGQGRRVKLIVENPDLAARFLDQQVVEDLVATRALAGSWPGSHLHHDGALLSTAAGQSDNARSRLRSATEWMVAHVRRAHELSNQHDVDDSDITALAWGLLNTNGPDASAEFLARWTPPDVARVCGEAVATRLVDAGRTEELEALALSPKATKHLQLAVAAAAHDGNVLLGKRSSAALAAMLVRHRKIIAVDDRHPNPLLRPVLWTVAMGLRHQVMKRQQALRILGLYLPDGLGHAAGASHNRSTETLLLAFAVRALLSPDPPVMLG